ncbi:MAG: glycerophosphodiester phosphodiesterase [Dyadobacter sp. 50-39]|uniref:glycerophosphodiester phosphodiesterase family protein n=1 Tax=Dyadobacter sp. 50-39 TaxID=1895756 RepID=UPI0009633C84|nr:glycerophosphodiester phosphodiesterase family protein [Dyadobacter sp. 50-39]OJV17652.1 MAG: glycerophosphodiester phosphodiesterase [Dyadobacter sp. 50-39]
MTRITLPVLLLSFIAFKTQAQVAAIRKEFLDADSKKVLVASHRAVHHQLPENSLPAIREAIKLGVDIVEIDVKVSRDGIPMLMHDGKVDRTTTGKGDLETQTFEELRKLRLVANGKTTEEKIPTLEEALQIAKGRIMVDLDLKTERIDKVIEVVKKMRAGDFVFFFDSDYEILSEVDAASKKYMLMPRAYSQAMADSALTRFKPEVIHIDSKFYTPEVTGLIRSKGARVWINALGAPDEEIRKGNVSETLKNLTQQGANIIQTDEPEKMIRGLRELGLHR